MNEEDLHQISLVEYCYLKNIPIVHIPNQGKMSKFTGNKLNKMGRQKGFPDIFIPIVTPRFGGLFIELKVKKTSKISPMQKFWINELNMRGYCAEIAYGLDHAINIITNYI